MVNTKRKNILKVIWIILISLVVLSMIVALIAPVFIN